MTLETQRRLYWLNVAWSALSVGVLFYCAWLGFYSPSRPDPATGHTYQIQWRLSHVYVTQPESLLFCAGVAEIAVYLIWCFFFDPLRTRRRKKTSV